MQWAAPWKIGGQRHPKQNKMLLLREGCVHNEKVSSCFNGQFPPLKTRRWSFLMTSSIRTDRSLTFLPARAVPESRGNVPITLRQISFKCFILLLRVFDKLCTKFYKPKLSYIHFKKSPQTISTDWFLVFMEIKVESRSYLQVRLPITDFVMQI